MPWISIPTETTRGQFCGDITDGPQIMLVPEDFTARPMDFSSRDEFLRAVLAAQKRLPMFNNS
jgi:hypothetical protein